VYLVLRARELNALLVGEESAANLGVDTGRFRKELLILTGLLTGTMVAVSGSIAFVGLIMPHIVRLFVGSDHKRVLPVSILSGAIFLIWVDILARIAVAPEELPVGVVTSLVGAPFSSSG
jgi:iron complex transport system permease protein